MRAEQLIEELALVPHPEGGFYREVFRDVALVPHPVHGAPRAAVTSIYFLLRAGTFSALHRVAQTEIWLHLAGDPVELHVFEQGVHRMVALGTDFAAGQRPQHVVPAHAWQAAVPRGHAWSLCGCTVAPGFDFADFQLPAREAMLRELPQHAALVTRLTRGETRPALGEVEVFVPRFGGLTEALVTRISVSVGDRVEPGTVLLELETDKATFEIPAELHGRVVAILVSSGDKVSVGEVLARLAPG